MKKNSYFLVGLLLLSGAHPLFVAPAFSQNGVPGACHTAPDKNVSVLNGSGTLGMSYSQTGCGLNYVQASQLIETRSVAAGFNTNGTGLPTTLSIGGIPGGHTILQAFVWYTVSYKTGPQITSVVINNTTVAATNIGQHGQKCWSEMGSVVYRADVTAQVNGNGNYTVDITGLGDKNWEVDGVTLMIIYKDNSANYEGTLIVWDGMNTCSAGGCTLTQTMTMSPACANSTAGNAFLIVSDMQTASINPPQHASTLNGTLINNLSNDFYNFDVANTNVTAGQNSASFGTAAIYGSDCFGWSVMGLYYQTTSCATCIPCAMTLNISPTPATCSTPGSATASASGASAPYTFSWSNGSTGTAVSNLAAGTYSLSVTDASGCMASQAFSILSSDPVITFSSSAVKCFGGNNGSATALPAGGNPPYAYAWSTNPVETNATATGLSAGNYAVTVTDANGWCTSTNTVSISQPTAILPGNSITPPSSCIASDGAITTGTTGGTPPYTYAWSNGSSASLITGLAVGSYTLTVTDGKGCKVTTIDSVSCMTGINTNTTEDIILYPNPTQGLITLSFNGRPSEISITDVLGRTIFHLSKPTQPVSADISSAPSGIYFLQVRTENGIAVKKDRKRVALPLFSYFSSLNIEY